MSYEIKIDQNGYTVNQKFDDPGEAFKFGKSLGVSFAVHESNDGLTNPMPAIKFSMQESNGSSGPEFLAD